MRAILVVLVFLSCAIGCAPTVATGRRQSEQTTHPAGAPLSPFDTCTVYTAREPATERDHRAPCSDLAALPGSPAAGGPHYTT